MSALRRSRAQQRPTLERLLDETAPPVISSISARRNIPYQDLEELLNNYLEKLDAGKAKWPRTDQEARQFMRRELDCDALNLLKAHRRRPQHVPLQEGGAHDRGTLDDSPLEEHERKAIIEDFLAELPPTRRAVWKLTHGEDLSRRDVARRLAITESAVATHLYHARTTLDRCVILHDHGRWCAKRNQALQAAEANGRATDRRLVDAARAHLDACTPCRHEYTLLYRRFAEGALTLIPTPAERHLHILERLHAATSGLRDWLAAGRAKAIDGVHTASNYLPGAPDLGDRALTTTKLGLATLCAAGAATAGVCTLAGVPAPLISQHHNPPATRSQARARAAKPRVKTELASYPHPPLPAYTSHTASTHTTTTGSSSSSTSRAPKPSANPNSPAVPAPVAAGETELGPDTGGTDAGPPPAPADPAAQAIGQP